MLLVLEQVLKPMESKMRTVVILAVALMLAGCHHVVEFHALDSGAHHSLRFETETAPGNMHAPQ